MYVVKGSTCMCFVTFVSIVTSCPKSYGVLGWYTNIHGYRTDWRVRDVAKREGQLGGGGAQAELVWSEKVRAKDYM